MEILCFFVMDKAQGYSFGFAKWEKRAIDEPVAEGSVERCQREGFTESIDISTSLLRMNH